jgi:hypothetical protein
MRNTFGFRLKIILLAIVSIVSFHSSARGDDTAPGGIEFFEKKVRPLLVDNCYNCHSANTNAKGGLRVDDRNGLLQGGNSGAAVVAGHPEKSLLIKAVSYNDDDLRMPPKKQLSTEQVAVLAQWIKGGAAWPAVNVPIALGKPNPKYETLRKDHWAWQPIREVKGAEVHDTAWSRNPIDQFILAGLETKNLKPIGDADKLALIRRITFDLTGLPPTPQEIDAFAGDASADAQGKVVDRLLASPAYGERWGRHWLDVARYGESTGSSRNVPYPHAWRYRDYVIDAFNTDKPYDQFVREQIAGDLLPANSQAEKDEHAIATGFLALGVKDVNQRFKVRFVMDNIDEQIDTVSRSVLGLTASCARCHDHKFDPIPQSEYYALAGIFNSTDLCAGVRNKMGGGGLDYYDPQMLLRLGEAKAAAPSEQVEKLSQEVAKARAEFQAIRGKPEGLARGADGFPKQRQFRLKMEKLQGELMALTDPTAGGGKAALGVRDAKSIGDTEIRIRGEAEKLGPVVPRGFLSLLQFADQPKLNTAQSGRLELAEWLTSPKNPLTPRVMANRIWEHLFGQGLVRSVDNFGVTGDVPSHPELLDYLATQFVRDGWSVKKLVRQIVLSRAYQLSSEESAANIAVDPSDRFVWRHNPRRLEAEEIRDATLAATGTLERSRPDASVASALQVRELRNNGPEAARFGEQARASAHRSVYLPLLRGLTPTALEVFDFAEQGMVTGSRDATTVATQALYLLNDPFVRRQSLALADRLLHRSESDDAERIDQAYRLTVGRPATTKEIERATKYLADYETAAREALASTRAPAKPAETTKAEATIASASTSGGGGGAAVNPDEIVNTDEPLKEDTVQAADARTAAWASLCQALFGTAEFRYLK